MRFKRWKNFGISATAGTSSWFFILVHFMKSHAACNVMVAKFHIPKLWAQGSTSFPVTEESLPGHSPGDRKSYPVNRKDRKAFTLSLGIPGYPWVFPAASGFQRLLHLAHLADCDTCEAARLTRSPIRSPTRAQWPQCWWAREISTNWRRRTMKTYERHMKNTWKTYERHKDVQSRKTTWIRDATLVKDFIPLQSGTGAFGHCSVMLLSRDAYRKCLVKPGGRFFLTFVVMLKLVEMVSPQPSACPQHVSKVSRCSRCLRNMSLMPPGFETGSPWHRPHECYIMLHNYHTIINHNSTRSSY